MTEPTHSLKVPEGEGFFASTEPVVNHSHPLSNSWVEENLRQHIANNHGATGLFVEHTPVDKLEEWHGRRHNKVVKKG